MVFLSPRKCSILLAKLCVYETDKSSKKASNGAITDGRIATIIGDKNIFLNPDGRAKQQGIGLSGFYTGVDTIIPVWGPNSSRTGRSSLKSGP